MTMQNTEISEQIALARINGELACSTSLLYPAPAPKSPAKAFGATMRTSNAADYRPSIWARSRAINADTAIIAIGGMFTLALALLSAV